MRRVLFRLECQGGYRPVMEKSGWLEHEADGACSQGAGSMLLLAGLLPFYAVCDSGDSSLWNGRRSPLR